VEVLERKTKELQKCCVCDKELVGTWRGYKW